MDLGARRPQAIPGSEPDAMGSNQSQSNPHAATFQAGPPRGNRVGRRLLTQDAPRPRTVPSVHESYRLPCVAYFSAEFGFHESVPNYSGGLGILSGDHCKSASDLDLNFYAVTLLYRHGYFKQQIGKDGWQEAVSLNQNFHHLPVRDARVGDQSVFVTVDILGRSVTAKVWELQIGRIKLFLLDTDIQQNSPEDRLITEQLYGGDTDMRIRQEIVLGIGGVRALDALSVKPDVYHMNEGHSAFLSLERIRRYVQEKGMSYYPALQIVYAGPRRQRRFLPRSGGALSR